METETKFMPRRKTRRLIVLLTLSSCIQAIAYLLLLGDPTNSLHTSAMSWSFSLMGATIGAYVFGAVFDNRNVLKGDRQ